MERKLASVQRIKDIQPINGADKIEVAIVLGWQVVVKKGEFKIGDLVYFFEIDSWVPNTIAPFLSGDKEPKEYEGVKGERLKTVKLRKQLSQGLVLPINGTPGIKSAAAEEGDDVTALLGVLKWESSETKDNSGTRQAKGAVTRRFPYFLRKTDQERVQNIGAMVEKAVDEEFEITVKKDGSSCTVFRIDPTSVYYADAKKLYKKKLTLWQKIKGYFKLSNEPIYGICSRNILLPLEGESNFHKAAREALDGLKYVSGSYAIQGEVVAPDIQGNYEKVKDVEYHVFDIFDIEKQEYLLPIQRRSFVKKLGLQHVTVIDENSLNIFLKLKEGDDIVKACLTAASGQGDNSGVMREGLVFKSTKRDFSFKAVSNEYLLKTGK